MPTRRRIRKLCLAATAVVAVLSGSPGYGATGASSGSGRVSDAPADGTQVVDPAVAATPSDADALGGYDVLIADRGNDRLLLVSPQKKILWQYRFTDVPPGSGADDAFFADEGKSIVTNLEHQQVIRIIDRATKKVSWEYGKLGRPGSGPGHLDFPDDAYKVPNGDVVVADIRNCRILEISPDKKIVRQAGITGRCWRKAPALASPNGDKPLPNGHILVSTIHDQGLIELDQDWKQILHLKLPIRYPSDPQMTKSGNFLVAGYTRPGKIIEITRDGKVVWQYQAKPHEELDRPSLAIELPNGNVMATDDLNQRVVVIDKATDTILWQYGVTHRRGDKPGYLHIPDGLDIIKTDQVVGKAD